MAMAIVGFCSVGNSRGCDRCHFAFFGSLATRDRCGKIFGNDILFNLPLGSIDYVVVFSFASLVRRVFSRHAFEF
jgi:hypothetical protein